MKTVPLHTLAHGRTGDKGNRSSISVIAYDPAHWPLLVQQVTEARVAQLFAFRGPSAVERYLLPKLHAMNFVIDDVLDGGVNGALNLDAHGKSRSSLLLEMEVELDEEALAPDRVPEAVWELWRQDDAGNRHLMQDRLTEAQARALAARYERRGHKQMYWAERARRDGDADRRPG